MILEPKVTCTKKVRNFHSTKNGTAIRVRTSGMRYAAAFKLDTYCMLLVRFDAVVILIYKDMLEEADEVTVADGGYRGTVLYRTPDDWVTLSDRRASSNGRACHETKNGRLKTFMALATKIPPPLFTRQRVFFQLLLLRSSS